MAEWSEIATWIGYGAGGISAAYGFIKGSFEGYDRVTDFIGRWRKPEGFKVKATVLKDIIGESRTETIKLRTLRAHRGLRQLSIDPRPKIVRDNQPEQPARITNFYSAPGRASIMPNDMLQIDLMEDEALAPHKDHSIVVGYVIEERLDDAFDPPGIIARQPVGSEMLVIEVHFPPNWHLQLNINDEPEIRLYSKDPKTHRETNLLSPSKRRWLPPKQIRPNVSFGKHDFVGSGVQTDWLRVSITKPPQEGDIYLDWRWKRETLKPV